MRDDLRRMVDAARFRRRSYRPDQWFWIVGNRPEAIFSSEAPGYVDQHDPRFVKFASEGKKPTRIATDAELAEVLRMAGLPSEVVQAAIPARAKS
jgi:hypothetical protein